jgi:hypothetical protein
VKNFAFHRPSPTHGCILYNYSALDVWTIFLNYIASSSCREHSYIKLCYSRKIMIHYNWSSSKPNTSASPPPPLSLAR